jgi:hypothetical protein
LLLLAWLDFYRKMKQRQSANPTPVFGTRFERFKWMNVASAGVAGLCFWALAYWFRFAAVESQLTLFVFANLVALCFTWAIKREWEDLKLISVSAHHGTS